MGQLLQRVVPGFVFNQVGIDYAGPFHIKYGYVRKPMVIKAYMYVFVSRSVKAVHLELYGMPFVSKLPIKTTYIKTQKHGSYFNLLIVRLIDRLP